MRRLVPGGCSAQMGVSDYADGVDSSKYTPNQYKDFDTCWRRPTHWRTDTLSTASTGTWTTLG